MSNIEFEKNYYFITKSAITTLLIQSEKAKRTIPETLHKRAIFDLIKSENKIELTPLKDILKPICQEGSVEEFIIMVPQSDYVRVRDEGNGLVTMSAKIHANEGGQITDQKEVQLKIVDFKSGIAALNNSTIFIQRAYQENKRETWRINDYDTDIYIDTWPGLETYIEIESQNESNVLAVEKLLGLDVMIKEGRLKETVQSVASLYAERYNIPIKTMLEERKISFETKPAWMNNPIDQSYYTVR